jgi:hypothetical protein
MNQWVLLRESDNAPEVVTFEAAGLTVGGTAKQTAEHVRKSWDLGQQAVALVRAEHGPDLCDELGPLAGGGSCFTRFRVLCMTRVQRQT